MKHLGLRLLSMLPMLAVPCLAAEEVVEELPIEPSEPAMMVDRAQQALAERVSDFGEWLDSFFGAQREEIEANYSFLRVTPSLQWDDKDQFDPAVRLRGKIHLPDTNDRLALVVSRDRDARAATSIETEDRTPIESAGVDDSGFGLQFVPTRTRKTHISLLATLDSDLDPELSVRVRRYVYPSDRSYAFASVRPFWSGDVGSGVALATEVDVGTGERSLVRLTTRGVAAEDIEGWEWKSSLAFIRQLGPRAAQAFTFSVDGVSEPNFRAETFTLSTTYRRNVWRPWIFWSVEPFVAWERDLEAPTNRIHGIQFEFDFYIGKQRPRRSGAKPVAIEPTEDESDLGREL
jgi:hypothetical protein